MQAAMVGPEYSPEEQDLRERYFARVAYRQEFDNLMSEMASGPEWLRDENVTLDYDYEPDQRLATDIGWAREYTDPESLSTPEWFRENDWRGADLGDMRRQAVETISTHAYNSAFSPMDSEQSIQELSDGWNHEGPGGPMELYEESYRQVFDYWRSKRDLWEDARTFAKKVQTKDPSAYFFGMRIAEMIGELSPEDKDIFDMFVAEHTEPEKRGFFGKVGETVVRETGAMSRRLTRSFAAASVWGMKQLLPVAQLVGPRGAPIPSDISMARTPELAYQERRLRGIVGTVDDIKAEAEGRIARFVQQGIIDAVSNLPRMLTTFVASTVGTPLAGYALLYTDTVPMLYGDLRDKGISEAVAGPLSMLFAAPHAAVELSQIGKLMPKVGKALGANWRALIGRAMLNRLKNTGKITAQEFLEEGIQNAAIEPLAEIVGKMFDPEAPPIDLADMLDEVKENLTRAAGAIPWMVLPGQAIGFATQFRGTGIAAPQEFVRREGLLEIQPAQEIAALEEWVQKEERIAIRLNRDARRERVAAGMEAKPIAEMAPAELAQELAEAGQWADEAARATVQREIEKRVTALDAQAQEAFEAGDTEAHEAAQQQIAGLRQLTAEEEVAVKEVPVPEAVVEAEVQAEAVREEAVVAEEEARPVEAVEAVERAVRIEEEAEAEAEWGAANAGVSTEANNAAVKRVRERMGRMMVGVPLDQLPDVLTIAAYHFEAGARKFGDWSKRMVNELGDKVKPYLKGAWERMSDMRSRIIATEKEEIAQLEAIVRPSEVRKRVKAVGRLPAVEKIEVSPRALLRYSLQHEARGARKGYRAGQVDLQASHKELVDFAKENLPAGEFKLVARAMERIAKTRTPGQMATVAKAINKMVANYETQAIYQEAKTAFKEAKKKKLRPEMKAELDALEEGFKLTQPTAKTLKRMRSVVKATELELPQGSIPQRLIERAEIVLSNEAKPLMRDLSPEELRGITAAIENIIHVNATKSSLLHGRQKRELAGVSSFAVTQVEKRHGVEYKEVPGIPGPRRRLGALREAMTSEFVPHETRIFNLVGDDTTAPNPAYQTAYRNLQEGSGHTITIRKAATDAVQDALADAGVDLAKQDQWWEKEVTIDLPTARSEEMNRVTQMKIQRGERIDLLAHFSDSETRALLQRNRQKGISIYREGVPSPPVKLYVPDIQAVIDSASDAEKSMAVAMQKHIAGPLAAELGPVWLRHHGIPLDLRKDHWGRRVDAEFRAADPEAILQGFQAKLLDQQGRFKSRIGVKAPIIITNALEHFDSEVNGTSAYIGQALPFRDATMLVKDRSFRLAVRSGLPHGADVLKQLESALRDYLGLERTDPGATARAVSWALPRVQRVVLYMKPQIGTYQTASLLTASNEIGKEYLTAGAAAAVSHPAETRAKIDANSPRLSARLRAQGHRILTPYLSRGTLYERYGKPESVLKRAGIWFIKKGDNAVVLAVYEAAEAEGRDRKKTGTALAEYTAQRAEDIFDRTQPTWDPLTMAPVLRQAQRNAFLKLMFVFASARLKNVSAAVRAGYEYQAIPASERTTADAGRLARKLAVPIVGTSLLILAMEEAFRVGVRGKEPWEWEQRILRLLEKAFGNWVFWGDFAPAATRAILEKKADMRENILAGAGETVTKTGLDLIATVQDYAEDAEYDSGARRGEKKWKYEAMRSAEGVLTILGFVFDLPTPGILQLTERLRRMGPPTEVWKFFDERTDARREYREAKESRTMTSEIAARYKKLEAFAKSIRQLQDAASDTDDPARREQYEERILELAKRALETE